MPHKFLTAPQHANNLLHFHETRRKMTLRIEEEGRGFKRARTGFIEAPRTKRPIDKKLVAIATNAIAATQDVTQLISATFPCTITGLRWNLSFIQDAGTGACVIHWAIVIVRDGVTIDTLGVSSAAVFFNPEQNCLVFGAAMIDNNTQSKDFNGSTKTMRKLMGGDTLQFIHLGVATQTSGCRGVIQFFCKT